MFEKHVRLIWVVIYGLWMAAFGIWAVGWVVESDHVGQLGILFAGVAATASVREFFIEHDKSVRNVITILRLGDPGPPDDHSRLRSMR